jgi:hypothetical protein
MMKAVKDGLRLYFFFLALIFIPGCATTVNFTYEPMYPASVESRLTRNVICYLSVTDARAEKSFIGYLDNSYGMKTTKVSSAGPPISASMYKQFKDVLQKKGFLFTDDISKSDFSLTFSLAELYAEMRSTGFNFHTVGGCCFDISLNSGKDNTELFKDAVCGIGEKTTSVKMNKNDIAEALIIATDNALDNILNGTGLIDFINKKM